MFAQMSDLYKHNLKEFITSKDIRVGSALLEEGEIFTTVSCMYRNGTQSSVFYSIFIGGVDVGKTNYKSIDRLLASGDLVEMNKEGLFGRIKNLLRMELIGSPQINE